MARIFMLSFYVIIIIIKFKGKVMLLNWMFQFQTILLTTIKRHIKLKVFFHFHLVITGHSMNHSNNQLKIVLTEI